MDNSSFGDIAITGFNSPPSTIILGESYDVSITITNLGSETVIGDPFPVSPDNIPTIIRNEFYLSEDDQVDPDDFLITQAIISGPLEPGESATGTASIFIDPPTDDFLGNSFIIFQTSDAEFGDGNGGDESNNSFAFAVRIVDPNSSENPVGDVAIVAANAPSTINIGETVELSLTITNVGNDSILGSLFGPTPFVQTRQIFNNIFLSNDGNLDSTDRQIGDAVAFSEELPLEPGESATLNFTKTFDRASVGNLTGNQFLIFETSDGEVEGVEGVSSENNTFALPITITGSSLIRGTASADTLIGDSENNEIEGLGGNDTIRGRAGDDTINGNNGSDRLFGQNGNDDLFGDNGNDRILGGAGNDSIDGNSGRDTLFGNNGADTIFGGLGNDELVGGDDSDVLSGGVGSDTLQGGNGDDTLSGGAGFDVLTGGAGSNVFVLIIGEDADLITDFNLGQDSIDVQGVSPEDVTAQGNIIKVGDEILATVTGVNLSNQSVNIF